jgi:hypothetical protein
MKTSKNKSSNVPIDLCSFFIKITRRLFVSQITVESGAENIEVDKGKVGGCEIRVAVGVEEDTERVSGDIAKREFPVAVVHEGAEDIF